MTERNSKEEEEEEGEEEELQGRERSFTGSDSMVSTASSSSEELSATTASHRRGWVNFDDDDSHKPPLPPPRSELDSPTPSGEVLANPLVETADEVVDYTPFGRTDLQPSDPETGRVSPFEDFGAQIAQTLLNQSRNRSSIDSYTANLIASASRDLFALGNQPQTIPERRESEVSLPEPLIPSSSKEDSRRNERAAISCQLLGSLDRGNCVGGVPSTNPFASAPLSSVANGLPAHPLVQQREWVRPKGPPPPKPKPYCGKPVSELQLAFQVDDPFGNLLEGMSLQAYASSSAAGNMCSSLPGLTSTPQHTSVESPLV